MGYVVTRVGGNGPGEFRVIGHEESELVLYARLLNQRGVKPGRAPRIPEPGSKRRWLYVWDDESKAQEFARDLNRRTKEDIWKVIEVGGPVEEGPLGPVLIQLADRGDRWVLATPVLSQLLIRSAYPEAFWVDFTSIYKERWNDFLESGGTLADLVARVAPLLTGLSSEQLEAVGYAVIDERTGKTLTFVPPAETAKVPVGSFMPHSACG